MSDNTKQAETEHCFWFFNRYSSENFPRGIVWKTECGREFDRMRAGEQPIKHLSMTYCPYCGRRIYDETQDC